MKYKNILNTIGNTPIIELTKYSSKKVKILAKLEGTNPSGSIKDRIALYMVKDAENKGLLKSESQIIEATSGNTGIALAMVAAYKRYHFTAVMPDDVTLERQKIIRAYGADLILTKGTKGTNYAIEVARDLVRKNKNYVMLDQFTNQANIKAHYLTTGREIIEQTPDITHFVAGMGTGGTLMGVGKRLKRFNKSIQIIGVEPKKGSKIQGLRNMNDYVPAIFNEEKLDKKLIINDADAFRLVKDLYLYEGISVGLSSGANLWGAIEISKKIKRGVIVTVFPDRGDKYLSLIQYSSQRFF